MVSNYQENKIATQAIIYYKMKTSSFYLTHVKIYPVNTENVKTEGNSKTNQDSREEEYLKNTIKRIYFEKLENQVKTRSS